MKTTTITFRPRGAGREVFALREPEIVISGPAGTGKSRSILEKLHVMALKYPRARLLIVRKTRRSLTESAMVTYWEKVRPYLDGVQWKPSMQQYQYPNGSIIAVGGMDKPSKIMSSEWDAIYGQEATELAEDDWEACTIRLRNGVIPYQQMLGDCNPDSPIHWLKTRANNNRVLMLESRHQDNPVLYTDDGQITPEGERYISRLEALSGVRLARYRYGVWASSENAIYQDAWDRSRNLINRFDIPRDWVRWLAVDFGYNHPFVCKWYAEDPDGRLYMYREIYKTKTLVEDHARNILLQSGWYHLLPKDHPKYNRMVPEWADPLPRAIICDHQAEDRATLERHTKMPTIPAKKTVRDGIQAVASCLRPSGDGKPRLYYLRDSLVELDRDLAESKRPTCSEQEFDSYVWRTDTTGLKEEPVKEFDDGMDCDRYVIAHKYLTNNTVTYYKDIWRTPRR